jgi:hypothetical protein
MSASIAATPAARGAAPDLARIGGLAALGIGVGYVAVIPIYTIIGLPPDGGAAWLAYGSSRTAAWWTILGLSVLTDVLYVPVAFALFDAFGTVRRNAMLLGVSLVGLFVVLDLAVTWSNYAALISLADRFAGAVSDAERATFVAAAEYASTVLTSPLEAVYSIVTLSIGLLAIGLVMLRAGLDGAGRIAGWLGAAAGVTGIVAVAASLVIGGLGLTIIISSTLTTAWAFATGVWMLRRPG